MQINGHLSEKDEISIAAEIMRENADAGIIGGYCEDGFPICYVNKKMTEMLGYDSADELKEAIGGKVINIICPDDLMQAEKDVGNEYYDGMSYKTTYRMLRKDGSWFWTLDNGKFFTAENGRLAALCVCTDMTDFVERQKKIEQRNFLSESLLKKLPGGYHRCIADDGLTFSYVSDCFLHILGWTEEELKTEFDNKFLNLVHPDDRAKLTDYANSIISAAPQSPYKDCIYRLKGKDGYRWVTDTSARVKAGEQTFYQCVISDITPYIEYKEKHEAMLKKALASANMKTEVLTALSGLFLQTYVVDLEEKRYDKVTTEGVKYGEIEKGGTLEEMANIGINKLSSPEYREAMTEFLNFDTLQERLKTKDSIEIEMKGYNGRWYNACFIVQKRNSVGKITRVIYVTSDINERKAKELQYENELVRSLQEIKRADIAKTDFLRRMSHDIRTPINGIRGMIEIANRFPNDMERQAECRKKIDEASGYLLALVNNVLDMNKLESGKIVLEHKPFDLVEMLRKANTIAELNAVEHGITFKADMEKCIITHKNVIGSPTHLQQILLNMSGNAIKYNRENGSVTVWTIETPIDDDTSMFRFICKDTGIGMSKEFLEHAFEPFAQEERSENSSFGSGLGLSIVKELVERMGGKIELESKLNEGTCFTVDIPMKIDKNASHKISDETNADKLDLNGKKALLVEDNELNTEIAEFILEEEGLTVEKAVNGKEAVEKFEASAKGEYSMIFMDIMMPVMNGLEASHKIRTSSHPDAKTVPIIAMSANVFQDDIKRSTEAGMNAYITKPLDINKIRETLGSMLNTNF